MQSLMEASGRFYSNSILLDKSPHYAGLRNDVMIENLIQVIPPSIYAFLPQADLAWNRVHSALELEVANQKWPIKIYRSLSTTSSPDLWTRLPAYIHCSPRAKLMQRIQGNMNEAGHMTIITACGREAPYKHI
jgi:hypothetical protein